MDTTALGEMIADRRRALRMSQDELAKLCGVSQGQISHLELGHLTNPRFVILVKVAAILDLSLDDLARTRGPAPVNHD